MIEPQENWQKEVREAEQSRIGDMNALAFSVVASVGVFVGSIISPYFKAKRARRKALIKAVNAKVQIDYTNLLNKYKEDILHSLNQSSIEQRFLVVNTLGREPKIKPFKVYDKFPKSDEFAITRRILSEKSILNRSKRLANRVADIIKDSHASGYSIKRTTQLIEIELGLRDKKGKKLTPRAKQLLKSGKFSRSNGHFYDFYRIARTETMRMASIQANNQFKELIKYEPSARLQMISRIDSRTRQQSIEMNRQISRKDGKFKYPNGFYYQHGEAPARYSINDRETTITVFIDDLTKGDKKYKTINGYKEAFNSL